MSRISRGNRITNCSWTWRADLSVVQFLAAQEHTSVCANKRKKMPVKIVVVDVILFIIIFVCIILNNAS